MQVKISSPINRAKVAISLLAADYKSRGLDRHQAWDAFLIDRSLKPEIDAKQFYKIYDFSESLRLEDIKVVSFNPTHLDTLNVNKPCLVQITKQDNGVFRLIWEDGSTGTNPPCFPPEEQRFIPLTI